MGEPSCRDGSAPPSRPDGVASPPHSSVGGRPIPGIARREDYAGLDAANRAGQPAQVELKESQVGAGGSLAVAPISINVYRFPVAE